MSTILAAEHIRFGYPGRAVIRGLSARFAPGRFYGVLGPNGSGKSTLLQLLAGLLRPSDGKIALEGRPMAKIPRREIARKIALVPQDFNIRFPFSARQIVLMGRYPFIPRFSVPGPGDRQRVETVMAQTATLAFAQRPVNELSGGERQRVVFARALAQETPILLLDEATSNLDIHHALSMLRLAARRVTEAAATVVAVFQDINLAALFCDEMLCLQQGEVSAFGPAAEVLNPALLRDVFQVDAKVTHEPFSDAPHVVFRR